MATPARPAVSVRNEVTITCPAPAAREDTEKFTDTLKHFVDDGYTVKLAQTISSGDQRDPYVIGIRIVLEKVA